jgi:hypothetical protein
MKDLKSAHNIYSLLDNELSRLHEFMERTAPIDEYLMRSGGGSGGFQRFSAPEQDLLRQRNVVYSRIKEIQDIVLKAFATHDAAVQEKVAELALTSSSGDSDPK